MVVTKRLRSSWCQTISPQTHVCLQDILTVATVSEPSCHTDQSCNPVDFAQIHFGQSIFKGVFLCFENHTFKAHVPSETKRKKHAHAHACLPAAGALIVKARPFSSADSLAMFVRKEKNSQDLAALTLFDAIQRFSIKPSTVTEKN